MRLKLHDIFSICILLVYTLFAIIFFNAAEDPLRLIFENVIISTIITIFSIKLKDSTNQRKLLLFKRILYAPLVFVIYSQVQTYITIVNPHLYDNLLIEMDRFVFGTDPTVAMKSISYPLLTEYLQFSYMTYFLMPLIHGIEWHYKKDDNKFDFFLSHILFAFYFSYLLYFFLPAIGPRFFLHEFSKLSVELPGLLFTDFFREIVNSGGGIINSIDNPMDIVNRDCMPSGHTMITTVNVILAFKLKSKFKWLFLILGTSLIFSTVYLRYHYSIDVIAGFLIALLIIWLLPKMFKSFLSKKY